MKYSLLVFVTFFTISVLQAQDESAEDEGIFEFSGFADMYFVYNMNKPASKRNTARVFDNRHNTFTVGMIQTQMTYTKGDVEIVGDLLFGPSAGIANYGNASVANSLAIKQAYIAYRFNDRLKMTIGQYGTHMGYEPVESTLNVNYSVSNQFAYGPIYHTGLKFDYQINEDWNFLVGMVNGWDELQDVNDRKSITFQLGTTAIENAEFYLNWIGGDEYNSPANFGSYRGSYSYLFDFVGKINVSDQLRLGINSGFGGFRTGATTASNDPHSMDGTWWAAALYLQYFPSDEITLGFRGEKLGDENNLRSNFGSITALTFTVGYELSENFTIKPELRIDSSDNEIFTNAEGDGNTTQPTIGVAFIGKF